MEISTRNIFVQEIILLNRTGKDVVLGYCYSAGLTYHCKPEETQVKCKCYNVKTNCVKINVSSDTSVAKLNCYNLGRDSQIDMSYMREDGWAVVVSYVRGRAGRTPLR